MLDTDAELLAEFVESRSEAAFGQIVSRHLTLVRSSAFRQVRDAHLAEDITQAVFIVLSRKASSVRGAHLPGWLLMTTRYCARNALREKNRRERHEREAAAMNTTTSSLELKEEFTGQIDEAMSRLPANGRTAVALRFLEQKSVGEVASALGITTDATQKVISRSLAKLRAGLERRGVLLGSTAVLGESLHHLAMGNFSVPGNATNIASTALSSPSIQASHIAKGAMNMIRVAKIKFAAAAIAGFCMLGAVGVTTVKFAAAGGPVVDAPKVEVQEVAETPAKNLAGFGSPFLELVGCRIKQTMDLHFGAAVGGAVETAQWTEQQYPLLRWKADPSFGGKLEGYTLTFAPEGEPDRAQLKQLDKSTTEFAPDMKEPGAYVVHLSAKGADGKPLAVANGRINIQAMPLTQIEVSDIQANGSIQYTSVTQILNFTAAVVKQNGFRNSDFVHVERMYDDNGDPVVFTSKHVKNTFQYSYDLNQPANPGDAIMVASQGTVSGLIHKGPGQMMIYSMDHSPGANQPVRRIELHRLPAGAKLVATEPADLPNRVVDGCVQIYVDAMIPVGGSKLVVIRYRIPEPI